MPQNRRNAFTLIELLVVVSIIALLIGMLMPSLSRARKQARTTVCATRLRTLGQGLNLYANDYADRLPPGRMPKVDDENWRIKIAGGLKYRPTFLSMMGEQITVPPFDDPQPSKTSIDRHGQTGDRQDYSTEAYVCPTVPDWTDERNAAYGYNYQFLGNARLQDAADPEAFKNWPVNLSRVRSPSACVAVADCLGTAASFAPRDRKSYANNRRDKDRLGNEGFNLDPPTVDPKRGDMAGASASPPVRSAADPRHSGKANVLWVDTHVQGHTPQQLGYAQQPDGIFGLSGDNRLWHINQADLPWVSAE